MSSQSYPRRHPDSAFRQVGEEGGLVVLPGNSEVKVLNPVGIKIFSMLDGEHSNEQIVAAVMEEFEIDAASAAADVAQFLDDLSTNGMLAGADERPSWEVSG